ncbi:MAG: branched-chain amino acid ABC transporter permease [Desulfurococcales archaeon]|nr:branched-chain amino acid ABC transporter permease [Desulfurococcales archaeon]
MDWNLFMSTTIYASVLALLSLGITLIYMTTKVFNFAHPRLSLVAAYASATLMAYYAKSTGTGPNLTPKETFIGATTVPFSWEFYAIGIVVSMVFGVIAALVEYYGILKPLSKRGADFLMLMIATLAYDFLLVAALFIYNTHVDIRKILADVGVLSTKMSMTSYDVIVVTKGGTFISGSFLFSIALIILLGLSLYLLLFKTTLGVKMRASVENPPLAEVLGINVEKVYAISWIISGLTAGLAGYLMLMAAGAGSLKPISATSPADEIVVSAFAGSIIGGVNSIFGSIGGGVLIGFVELYIPNWLAVLTGNAELFKYSKVISMLAVALTLLFAPEGLSGLIKSGRLRRILSRKEEGV